MSDDTNDSPFRTGPDDHRNTISAPPATEHVDHTDSAGADLFPEYIPTRDELEVLVKYWLSECRDIEIWQIVYQQSSGSDLRRVLHARTRVSAAEACLGEAVVQALDEEIKADLLKGLPDDVRAMILTEWTGERGAAETAGADWASNPENRADLECLNAAWAH